MEVGRGAREETEIRIKTQELEIDDIICALEVGCLGCVLWVTEPTQST